MRQAAIYFQNQKAGLLTEDSEGYSFVYDDAYLASANAHAISLTLPLRSEPYRSNMMLPFFDGLIPEGWLLAIAERNWKIDGRDRMALLMACCRDCIGAVSVRSIAREEPRHV